MRDLEMFSIIEKEEQRQKGNIELIASENFVSKEVREAQGSVLTNKYAEGYPGKRYYGGCVNVDAAEDLARKRACELFHAEHVNVQPHSGSQANMAVYNTLLTPGDTVMGMDLAAGGHLTHGHPMNFSGTYYNFVPYMVDRKTERIDYDALEKQAMEVKPKLIVAGASAYSRIIDFERFGKIAKQCGAYLMVDMAHIAGLVAAGLHPSPIPYADFVTTTTHKTLRGPRGGMVFCKEEFAKKLDSKIFPGMQGGPLEHVIAAKGICLFEAMQPSYKEYMEQVLKNVQVMVKGFKELGWPIDEKTVPHTTFYLWLPIPKRYSSTFDFCADVLEKSGVVLVPGNAFGNHGEGYFRLSYVASDEQLQEVIDRFKADGFSFN